MKRTICALGLLAWLLTLMPATGYAATITFSNTTPIAIPDSGAATPYPSQVTVTGMGTIVDMSLSLIGFSHSFPADVGVLLVGPTGIGEVVFAGGTTAGILNAILTFADGGAPWPGSGSVGSGTFQPTSFRTSATFPAPAPLLSGVNPTTVGLKSFSVFDGSDPNGLWSLFAVDFAPFDQGSIAGGWSLTITDGPVSPVPEPSALLLLSSGIFALSFRRRPTHQ